MNRSSWKVTICSSEDWQAKYLFLIERFNVAIELTSLYVMTNIQEILPESMGREEQRIF